MRLFIISAIILFCCGVVRADDFIFTDKGDATVIDLGDGDKIISGDVNGVVLSLD